MKISVVTPSYNQGRYLEETLMSVLGQGYPDLEYIVMDGGSTDHSVEIIERHEKELAYWASESDGGQANAINRGFEKATGDVLCWLNSDDLYLPGTLRYVVEHLEKGTPDFLFGNCVHLVDATGAVRGTDVQAHHARSDLRLHDYLVQPATFLTREAWERVGPLDESLHYAFDWDWFIRMQAAGVRFTPHARPLAVYRIHPQHKTASGADVRRRELAIVFERHAGNRYARLFARACEHAHRVRMVQEWTRRLRVPALDVPVLKLLAPRTFLGYEPGAIRDVANMI
jgi:glycosyltransferase involved in cell wall biosynthesis